MQNSIYDVPNDLGMTLSELRKAAKKKQAEIAESLNVAQSHISRIEKGKVTPSDTEVKEYLSTVATDEALYYLEFLKPWKILKRPSFRNPQRDELWKAEASLIELQKLISEGAPDLLVRQAEMHDKRVREEAEYLASLEHSIAYVGSIGVGKTTAVCKLTRLVIPQEKQFNRQSVLAVGAGRTTVCEVCIRRGEKFGIRVKPQSPDDINKLVEDFCADQKNSNKGNLDNHVEIIVSQEIQRLLLNMAGLQPENFAELVQQYDNVDTLRFKLLEMIKLQERTREEIWFEETTNHTGIEWLKETFKLINYGRHKDFSVPQQIDVIVPDSIFHISEYELEIVDTRGIDKDGTAIRRDLMDRLNNQRTLTVLCSRFKDAPDSEINDIISNLIKNGSEKVLKERVILLVLPQNDEPDNMMNHAGEPVDSKEEAYNLKRDEAQTRLQPLLKDIDVRDIPILFFNAKSQEDESEQIARALIDKLDKLRFTYTKRLSNTVEAINALIKNQKEQNAQEAYKKVNKSLKIFLNEYRDKKLNFGRIHDKLLTEMKKTHAGTIRATTRRNGTLNKFDVYFLLGNGARFIAWNATLPAFYELKGVLKNISGDVLVKEYAENFVNEILKNWEEWHQEFLAYAEQIGEQVFRPTLIKSYIWEHCASIKGSGFREDVIATLRRWFIASEQQHLHDFLNQRVEEAWQEKVLAMLDKLTDDSTLG